jgi:hypothetical protein
LDDKDSLTSVLCKLAVTFLGFLKRFLGPFVFGDVSANPLNGIGLSFVVDNGSYDLHVHK